MVLAALLVLQQALSPAEKKIATRVDANAPQAIALLERSVNINSGSLNRAGVRRVYDVFAPELEALGFKVHYADVPDSLKRGGHLVAERTGTKGKRVLLIGHLDTVFEESSPFQTFQRIDAKTAAGPGTQDMKGGDVAIIYALRALNDVHALDNATITVVFTGDEESPGNPVSVARQALIDAGKNSDVALAFEGGSRDAEGDEFVVARRGSTGWIVNVTGVSAHSSGTFAPGVGAGAIYEAGRILDRFYGEVRGNRNVTFNAAMIVGGTEADFNGAEGHVSGKSNIVPAKAIIRGDLRTLTDEELNETREHMRAIVAQSLPGTRAEIKFSDGYPTMPPTAANLALLKQLSDVNVALGLGPARAFEPSQRGAGDVSFVAKYVAALDGLGPLGDGSHTDRERVDLESIKSATKRAALLVYRLTNGKH